MIRSYSPADAAAVAAILRESLPGFVFTARGVDHWLASRPERAALAASVLELDGEVVGYSQAELIFESSREGGADLLVAVSPSARTRGGGAQLYEAAEAHLLAHGARELVAHASDDAGERFLSRRGYEHTRTESISTVDPRTVRLAGYPQLLAQAQQRGYGVRTLAELAHRPRDLYELFTSVDADVPCDYPYDRVQYEDWKREVFVHPDISRDGSFVVVDGHDRCVALAWLEVDVDRHLASNALTGTAREHRRQGLAALAKFATIDWSVAAGIREISTGNDTSNSGMLHINRALGYRPLYEWKQYSRAA